MKDIIGNDLVISDMAATTVNGYSDMVVLKVVGFTNKKIRLEYKDTYITKLPDQVSLVNNRSLNSNFTLVGYADIDLLTLLNQQVTLSSMKMTNKPMGENCIKLYRAR